MTKFQKYKKLIYSQICALLACTSLGLGILRYSQTNDWTEQMTLSFMLFAVVLFVVEMRMIYQWLKENKTRKEISAA